MGYHPLHFMKESRKKIPAEHGDQVFGLRVDVVDLSGKKMFASLISADTLD